MKAVLAVRVQAHLTLARWHEPRFDEVKIVLRMAVFIFI